MDETVVQLVAECIGSIRPVFYVYFLRNDENGLVKIGYGGNPWGRLAAARSDAGQAITGVALLPGGQAVERYLHRRFSTARQYGEWFAPVPELLAYIEAHAEPWHGRLFVSWGPGLTGEVTAYERRLRTMMAVLERQLALIERYR